MPSTVPKVHMYLIQVSRQPHEKGTKFTSQMKTHESKQCTQHSQYIPFHGQFPCCRSSGWFSALPSPLWFSNLCMIYFIFTIIFTLSIRELKNRQLKLVPQNHEHRGAGSEWAQVFLYLAQESYSGPGCTPETWLGGTMQSSTSQVEVNL